MDKHYERAWVLLGQRRYDLAADELRLALANDPNDATLHALLGLCLVEAEQWGPATEEARQAVHLGPDLSLGHYVLARALSGRNRLGEAEAAAREALRLDPEDADHYGLLASIQYDQRRWQDALKTAEEGLEKDAEHVGCTNLRAMALVKLGRAGDAQATLSDVLALDPENALSHASQGWALLHQGQTRPALEHFREALRLEPGLDFARAGIVEAMKARNPIYGVMLRYFLFMGRLSRRAQWAIILGLYFGQRALAGLAQQDPAWKPWVTPILVVYVAFAVLTWLAGPLFNLLLRLDRFGRHALSREQVVASNWVGALLVPALVSVVAWFVTRSDLWFLAMIYFGLLLLPVAGAFAVPAGWPRRLMAVYAGALALTPLAAVAAVAAGVPGLVGTLVVGFLWGTLLSGLVANGLMMVRPLR
jgi:tetratricopeptide (TPR) repeat protein